MTTKKDLVPLAEPTLQLIREAMDRGMSAEQLGQFMTLHERHEANQAKRAWSAAMTTFQSRAPVIFKNRTATIPGRGNDGGWSFNYAGYEDVMKQIEPLLTECGIVLTFTAKLIGEAMIECTCRVRVGLHVEETTLPVPIPKKLVVDDAQKFGAALSYAQRYTAKAALNLRFADDDDEAKLAQVEVITDQQAQELAAMIAEKGVDLPRFLSWAGDGIEKLADVPAAMYAKAVDMLKRRKVTR